MSEEQPTRCTDPCLNPGALEYQKCFKAENNNGCGCSCDNGERGEIEEENATVVRKKLTRGDFV